LGLGFRVRVRARVRVKVRVRIRVRYGKRRSGPSPVILLRIATVAYDTSLIFDASWDVKFNHCSVTCNHRHESTVSSELLAKVAVFRDMMLLFRDNPNLCTGLFGTDEIAASVFVLTDNAAYFLSVSLLYIFSLSFYVVLSVRF